MLENLVLFAIPVLAAKALNISNASTVLTDYSPSAVVRHPPPETRILSDEEQPFCGATETQDICILTVEPGVTARVVDDDTDA